MKPENEVVPINPALLKEEESFQREIGPDATVAERMEESRSLAVVVGVAIFAYLGIRFAEKGIKVDINTVNMMFVGAGILLHKTPMAYARAITAAAKGTAGIMIQFPFYAGIQLMMEHSGLGGIITNWFVDIATKETFPLLAFLSSGLINFAVPSGGGHWVVQGPFVMPAAQALGADLGKSAMAIAVLGATGTGHCWPRCARHHGLLRHRPDFLRLHLCRWLVSVLSNKWEAIQVDGFFLTLPYCICLVSC
jgi:short-chain fatty acids transporter